MTLVLSSPGLALTLADSACQIHHTKWALASLQNVARLMAADGVPGRDGLKPESEYARRLHELTTMAMILSDLNDNWRQSIDSTNVWRHTFVIEDTPAALIELTGPGNRPHFSRSLGSTNHLEQPLDDLILASIYDVDYAECPCCHSWQPMVAGDQSDYRGRWQHVYCVVCCGSIHQIMTEPSCNTRRSIP